MLQHALRMTATGIKAEGLRQQRKTARRAFLTPTVSLRTSLFHHRESRLKQTKAASDFDTEYRAGNVRDIELFSIGSKGVNTVSECDTGMEKPYYVYVRVNEKRLKFSRSFQNNCTSVGLREQS